MEAWMNKLGRLSGIAAAGLVLLSSTELVKANPLMGPSRSHEYVTIGSDRGGYVIKYALRMLKWRKSGTSLRFAGRCESACTIYLALPSDQTCIVPGASFRFHAPYGAGTKKDNRIALSYMLNSYPGWVRSWIRSRGGLTRQLISMDYGYASKHMRACVSQTAELTKKNTKS